MLGIDAMASSKPACLTLLGALSVVLLTVAAHSSDQTLRVQVDRASVVRAPDNTATVVIGNPLIADAITQKNGVLVVTGKSFGSTNIMLLDAAGTVLSETIVYVGAASDGRMVVHRGTSRETFSCNPRCEVVLGIGDNKDIFKDTADQITQRGNMSTGKGE